MMLISRLRSIVSVSTTAYAYTCLVVPPSFNSDGLLLLLGVGICAVLHGVERVLQPRA